MPVILLLQTASSTDTTSNCLTAIITWLPFLALIALWLIYMRRIGYFTKRGGYIKRSEDHMDRVEQTLNRIEEHLRKIAERDDPKR